MVKFNQKHMKELEQMFRVTPEQREGFDSLPSDFADILSTFNWAMHEGSASLIHVGCSAKDKEETLNFVGEYCASRKISHDILFNEVDQSFHLYLHQ